MNKAYVQDGDVGCGAPGSLIWHKCNMLQLDDMGKIDYIRECFPSMSEDEKLDIAIFLILGLQYLAKNPVELEEKIDGDGN